MAAATDSDPDCSLPSEKNEDEEDFNSHDPMDTFKILITTDNHLGYMERDPERGQDSFVSLEEAFDLAKVEQVDFILLGGDLFHENKPSRDCLTRCQKIFRDYCFGNKPLEFEILSDEKKNFGHTGVAIANFNDPNLNISIPVFSIHGNHDDPTGQQNLCALDTLAVAGLMNYFGKSNTSCDQGIEIVPILLEKGRTKLAIYGLGAIKDERLYNMFEKGLVQFVRPAEDTDQWFSIFLIHQNRSAHSKKNYIPETFLPEFLDLVIWGHEHECRIRPEYNELQRFYVSQPGSSVITSLSESELAPKHVALLKIHEKSFKLEPLPLRTVRQFAMDTVVLAECGLKETDKNVEAKIEQMLTRRIDKLVDECAKNRYYCEKQPTKPLIRIKVDYSGTSFEPINEIRFAQKMVAKLANPKNIFQIYKKAEAKKEEGHLDTEAAKVLRMHGGGEQLEYDKVQDLVSKYFKKADEKNKMLVLTEKGLGDAIQEYIEKDEKDAIGELVHFQIEKMQKYLKNEAKWENEYQLHNEIKKFQEMRMSNQKQEEEETREVFEKCTSRSRTTQPSSRAAAAYDDDDEEVNNPVALDSDEETSTTAPATAGRGRGRGRGAAGGGRGSRGGGRGRGRGAGASSKNAAPVSQFTSSTYSAKKSQKSQILNLDDSDNDIIDVEPPNDDDEEDECCKGKPSGIKKTTQTTATNQKRTNEANKTTTGTRRTRIEYEDEEDDLENRYGSAAKKSKAIDDANEESTNTFSIFRKVANKKKL